MKIIITESQFNNLIPNSLRRRLEENDFDIIDSIIDSNLRFWVGGAENDVDEFVEEIIKNSLNEFVVEYKLDEYIDHTAFMDDEDEFEQLDEKDKKIFEIYWKLIPFLEMEYKDKLSDYYKRHKYIPPPWPY